MDNNDFTVIEKYHAVRIEMPKLLRSEFNSFSFLIDTIHLICIGRVNLFYRKPVIIIRHLYVNT